MSGEILLPRDYPRFGRAVDEASAALADVPVPLAALWNPLTCPESHLAWLAWALSVDVWDDAWPVEAKRDMTARALQLHRLKGTLAGIRAYVEAAGGVIVRAETPPATAYAGASLTADERAAYLATLPQIRIYERFDDDAASPSTFWNDFSGCYFLDPVTGASLMLTCEVDLGERAGTFAVLWRAGEATPIERATVSEISGDAQRVFVPALAPGVTFSGEPLGLEPYLWPSSAAERVYTFSIRETPEAERLLYLFPIGPGHREAINTEPDHVAEPGLCPAAAFCGEPMADFLAPTGAETRLYRAIYINDPDRPGSLAPAVSYMDDCRFGLASFTAELSVVVHTLRPWWVADDFVYGFFYDGDGPARLAAALDAIDAAKAARDVVLVGTNNYHPLTVGGAPLFVGEPLIVGNLYLG